MRSIFIAIISCLFLSSCAAQSIHSASYEKNYAAGQYEAAVEDMSKEIELQSSKRQSLQQGTFSYDDATLGLGQDYRRRAFANGRLKKWDACDKDLEAAIPFYNEVCHRAADQGLKQMGCRGAADLAETVAKRKQSPH